MNSCAHVRSPEFRFRPDTLHEDPAAVWRQEVLNNPLARESRLRVSSHFPLPLERAP
jgi:hypothetical protein